MSFLSYTQDFNDNLLLLLLRDHNRYMPIVRFFETMTRDLSELSWAETELIAAEISKANRSRFCTGIREGMSKSLKADPASLGKDKLAAVLRFALKINHDPGSITPDAVDEVIRAGWSEQTVEDIVGLVAIQTLYNILATGLGFKRLPDAVFSEIGRDTVNRGGYVASFQQFIDNLEQ